MRGQQIVRVVSDIHGPCFPSRRWAAVLSTNADIAEKAGEIHRQARTICCVIKE